MTSHIIWKTGAAFTAVGMIAEAFGAHGLKSRTGITPDQLQAWRSAAQYVIYNGLGLLAISLHPRSAQFRYPALAIVAGSLVFSGSIIALVLNRERFRFLGPFTPLGGAFMIGGYLALAVL